MIRGNRKEHYARNGYTGVDYSKFASQIPLENVEIEDDEHQEGSLPIGYDEEDDYDN